MFLSADAAEESGRANLTQTKSSFSGIVHSRVCLPFWTNHSTVTDFARLRGWSISQPRRRATW